MKREDLESLNIPADCIDVILDMHETEMNSAATEMSKNHDEKFFEHLLNEEITKADARSSDIVKTLLDLDALKNSDDQIASIRQALGDLKETAEYLFQPPAAPPYATGTGTVPMLEVLSAQEEAFRSGIGVKEGGQHNE